MIVAKFGGTSVASAASIAATAEIVRGRLSRTPFIVVSALGGVTNALLAAAEQATAGKLLLALQTVEGIRSRHFVEAEALLGQSESATEVCARDERAVQ